MINTNTILQTAYDYLKQIEDVRQLNDQELEKLGHRQYKHGWEISTEIQAKERLAPLTLYFLFKYDFPLSLPKVYISDKDYQTIKYIPHVNEDKSICTYDEENIRIDTRNIEGIIRETLKRAKEIIKQGIEKSNLLEFKNEFLAYWDHSYEKKDVVRKDVLTFFADEPQLGTINGYWFKYKVRGFSFAFFNDEESEKRFKHFLDFFAIEYSQAKAFYIKDFFKDYPPFTITVDDLLNHVKKNITPDMFKEFEHFINISPFRIIISKVTLTSKTIFIGLGISNIQTQRDGFRPGTVTNIRALRTWHKNELLSRIYLQDMSPSRIGFRTEGTNNTTPYRFLVAGNGSIGSNLISLLNTISNCDFDLIDPDNLSLENIGRHLLGFDYIGDNKAVALKKHLLKINPLQNVNTFKCSIFSNDKAQLEILNKADFLFIAIGKSTIESWIVDLIEEGTITKPVFILWVEPYLFGGHCIYLHPSSVNYKEYFSKNGLYKYNIINENEYIQLNPLLVLNEAGCQTSFIPFSRNSIVLFLNSIFSFMQKIITQDDKESKKITWTGDLDKLHEMKIQLSDFAKPLESMNVYV